MTAREFLKKYEYALDRVELCREQYIIESLQIDAIRSASDNDGMPHGNGKSDPTANKAVKLSNRLQRLIDAEQEALEIQQNIFDAVMQVGGIESKVLVARYLKLMKWEDVCKEVNYSWFVVRQAWHDGEKKLQTILDKSNNNIQL